VWQRPQFEATKNRALLDLVVFTRDKPALGIDLGEEDGFPEGYDLPATISIRTAALDTHADRFASFLEGPFRELAADQIGDDAANAISDARHAVSIEGKIDDPADLRHLQVVRAFQRFLARTVGAVAIANDLSLRWQDAAPLALADPPDAVRVDDWIEVLYDDELRGLHTRGMAQFARPDIAVFDAPEDTLARAAHVLRRIGELEAFGKVFADGAAVEVDGQELRLALLDAARCEALAVARGTLVLSGISY